MKLYDPEEIDIMRREEHKIHIKSEADLEKAQRFLEMLQALLKDCAAYLNAGEEVEDKILVKIKQYKQQQSNWETL
jgi:hypothetical protein